MATIRTKCGYEFEVEEVGDLKVRDGIHVPNHDPGEVVKVPRTHLQFLAQMYASRAQWGERTLKRYGTTDVAIFPEKLFHMSNEQVWDFMTLLYSRNARLIKHSSGTSDPNMEVWMPFEHQTQAQGLQKMWSQLGIKTAVYYHKQMDRWLCRASGVRAYVQMRPMLLRTRVPKIKERVKVLDTMVPFGWRVREEIKPFIWDKIVEIIE